MFSRQISDSWKQQFPKMRSRNNCHVHRWTTLFSIEGLAAVCKHKLDIVVYLFTLRAEKTDHGWSMPIASPDCMVHRRYWAIQLILLRFRQTGRKECVSNLKIKAYHIEVWVICQSRLWDAQLWISLDGWNVDMGEMNIVSTSLHEAACGGQIQCICWDHRLWFILACV